jgi:hypothetical protein
MNMVRIEPRSGVLSAICLLFMLAQFLLQRAATVLPGSAHDWVWRSVM